ncbi:MAG: Crp/Fnr family transcriptional regulator [Ardenticatenaceae bacterium]|nr:Crp/Fnr family transcriptional regulator [Ardenticatenaceae bacterium]
MSKNELRYCLEKAPVFSKLNSTDRNELVHLAQRRQYEKGACVCLQDTIWDDVLHVHTGRLGWSMLSPDGKRQLVFEIVPCDFVWGHSLFDREPMPASLEAVELTVVYAWPRQTIIPIVSRQVDAVWDVTRVLVKTMRTVREVVYGFAFHQVSGRLARLLLNRYGPQAGQSVRRDITLDEMADAVGTTRELVSRVLHRFDDEGVIKVTRTKFVFTDLAKLESMVE